MAWLTDQSNIISVKKNINEMLIYKINKAKIRFDDFQVNGLKSEKQKN